MVLEHFCSNFTQRKSFILSDVRVKVGEGGSIREGFTAQLRCSGQPLINEPKGELDYFSQQSGPRVNPGLLMAQTDQSVLNASLALDFHLHVPRRSRRNPLKQAASAGTPDRGDGMFLNVSAEK